jgi:hypothetical protein
VLVFLGWYSPPARSRPAAAHDRPVPDQRVGLMHLVQVEAADAEAVRAGHRALLDDRGDREQREELRYHLSLAIWS